MNAITSRIAARIQSAFLSARAEVEVRRAEVARSGQEGASTVEYAAVSLAALGLAGLLIALLKSGYVNGLIKSLIGSMFKHFLNI